MRDPLRLRPQSGMGEEDHTKGQKDRMGGHDGTGWGVEVVRGELQLFKRFSQEPGKVCPCSSPPSRSLTECSFGLQNGSSGSVCGDLLQQL